MRRTCIILIFIICLPARKVSGQSVDNTELIEKIPARFYSKIEKKINSVDERITKKSLKYLSKFQRQEQKLQQKIQRLNPELVLQDATGRYTGLLKVIKGRMPSLAKNGMGEYLPYTDSLGTSLSFLNKLDVNGFSKANDALKSFNQLEDNLQQSEEVKAFIAERKSQIASLLSNYTKLPPGIKNEFKQLNKTAYYYSAQVKEYKELLNDPDKIELKVLELLNKVPAFQKFVKENSALAGLFSLPRNYSGPQALTGLQTRDQVAQLITNRIGSGSSPGKVFSQQIQVAQQGLQAFKDKLSKLGGGSGDIEMPDFKPNGQKTKPFLKRLEYGSNLQTFRGSYGFPTTTDLGLSVGYKLNNKGTIGIGASYKTGWGTDLNHIRFTAEGMGLRSYFEYNLKKTFYATGGLEYNYQPVVFSRAVIPGTSGWQQSGLIGVSKVVALKSKLFKKTKVQVLWDFMSYYQPIRTQVIKFRVGYDF